MDGVLLGLSLGEVVGTVDGFSLGASVVQTSQQKPSASHTISPVKVPTGILEQQGYSGVRDGANEGTALGVLLGTGEGIMDGAQEGRALGLLLGA